jgi:hypothetical protein
MVGCAPGWRTGRERVRSRRRLRRSGIGEVGLPVALAALLIGLTAGALAGCGASRAVDPVAQAAKATTRVSGARSTIAGAMVVAGHRIVISGTGFMDLRGQRGVFDFQVRVRGRSIAARELLVHRTIYMTASFLRGKLPHGKTWMKIDIARAAKAQGVDLAALQSPGGGSPQDQLQYLLASTHASNVGSETVRGVHTTHYHTTVDLNQLPRQVPPARRAATETSVRNLQKLTHTSTIPIDVWIDRHHLVRRERAAFSMTLQGHPARTDFTFELYDFGTRFAATPPPANQVYDATGAASQPTG